MHAFTRTSAIEGSANQLVVRPGAGTSMSAAEPPIFKRRPNQTTAAPTRQTPAAGRPNRRKRARDASPVRSPSTEELAKLHERVQAWRLNGAEEPRPKKTGAAKFFSNVGTFFFGVLRAIGSVLPPLWW